MTEDEMVGWYHCLDGHEIVKTWESGEQQVTWERSPEFNATG